MTPRIFAGIDPGQSGGLVCLNRDGRIISCAPMPDTERDIWEWFEEYSPQKALVEKVHSMPGQGVSSSFKFGMNYGLVRMALIAAGSSFDQVTPQKWIKGIGIPSKKKTESKTQWKNRLKAKAQQLFPQQKVTLKTADALLIAEYCRRTFQ